MTETEGDSFKTPLSVTPAPKKDPIPDLNYEEPDWSGAPPSLSSSKYEVEVLKNGVIIESYPLSGKNFFVLGRLPVVDIPQEHPSLSRHHAIIQYRPGAGFFLFDLDSAHGTFHNKRRILPRTYVPLRVGHSIKLGGSSRLLLFQGPEDDSEPEVSMEAVKEYMDKKKQLQEEGEDKASSREEKEKNEAQGISWGMREDAVEETPSEEQFILSSSSTPLNLDDPKKTLRHWFEREGYELEYKVEEKGHSNFLCTIDIPTDTGEPLIAEVKAGKKKEAMIQCALEACRLLDKRGLLRASSAASKRKSISKNWEDADYYDSDDDEFLDRTGSIQEKRLKRMKLANKSQETVENHESLKSKFTLLEVDIAKIQSELTKAKDACGSEDLDDYMASLNGGAIDKHTVIKLKTKLNELKREQLRLSKLIELTKPSNVTIPRSNDSEKKILPGGVMIGKRFGGGIFGKTRMIPKKTHKDEPCKVNEGQSSEDNDVKSDSSSNKSSKESSLTNEADLELSKKKEIPPPTSVEIDAQDSESTHSTELPPKELPCSPDTTPSSPHPDKPSQSTENKKKKKIKPHQDTQNKKALSICDEGKIEGNYSSSLSDPKYSTWVPPANQSGDGRTSLNDKFGY